MSQVPNQTPAQSTIPAQSTPSDPSQVQTPSSSGTPAPAAAKPDEGDGNFLGDEPTTGETAEDNSFASASDVEELDYELELPEDSLVPDEDFDALVEEAKAEGLSEKEAKARLALLNKAFTKAKEQYLKAEGKRLMSELVKDPMFATKEAQIKAKKDIDAVYAAYKDPDFMKFVKSNPLIGSNIHFVKFMVKLGKSLQPEGAPKTDGSGPSHPQTPAAKSVYETMYPNEFKTN